MNIIIISCFEREYSPIQKKSEEIIKLICPILLWAITKRDIQWIKGFFLGQRHTPQYHQTTICICYVCYHDLLSTSKGLWVINLMKIFYTSVVWVFSQKYFIVTNFSMSYLAIAQIHWKLKWFLRTVLCNRSMPHSVTSLYCYFIIYIDIYSDSLIGLMSW